MRYFATSRASGAYRSRMFVVCFVGSLALLLAASAELCAQDADYRVWMGPAFQTRNPVPNIENFQHVPDGHITAVFPKSGQSWMIWPGATSHRVTGSLRQVHRPEVVPVLGRGAAGEPDNGGAWLYGAYLPLEHWPERHGSDSLVGNLVNASLSPTRASVNGVLAGMSGNPWVGFYHAEDHEFPGSPGNRLIAWKQIHYCTSADDGWTWEKGGALITSDRQKPDVATWGGSGDFCIVRDVANGRWLCFYAEHYLYVAESRDVLGRPGTWFKYHEGNFDSPGLGGPATPIPSLLSVPGGNPSVHFNESIDRWVMVWQSWDSHPTAQLAIWMSTSRDLFEWTQPRLLMEPAGEQVFRYPTITGFSDQLLKAGARGFLHYAEFPHASSPDRKYMTRAIEITPK